LMLTTVLVGRAGVSEASSYSFTLLSATACQRRLKNCGNQALYKEVVIFKRG